MLSDNQIIFRIKILQKFHYSLVRWMGGWKWLIFKSDFWKLLRSPLIQFSKFNNFFWECWFLGKNLSNFVPPIWKLHNLYCHNVIDSNRRRSGLVTLHHHILGHFIIILLFRFSEKATKVCWTLPFYLTFANVKIEIKWKILSDFRGLLRKHELYWD